MSNKTILRTILTIIITMLLILASFSHALASSQIASNALSNNENAQISENITSNTSNRDATNSVKSLSLNEQKNQVQEQLNNANDQLSYVEDELSEKMISIQKIEDRIAEYKSKLDKVNGEYDKIEKEVNEAEESLQKVEAEYNKKDKILKKRLVDLYKRGQTSYLAVLLGSRDMLEFISNYFVIQAIVKYDSKEIKAVDDAKKQIEKTTNELKEKKANMKLIKAEAEKQTVIYTNTKTILENEKASLNDSEQALLAEIDSYKKQQEEINNLIQYQIRSSTYELQYSGGIMAWPTLSSSYITSPFGTRMHPIQGIIKNHAGIDIGGKMSDPIYAAADGIIIYSNFNNGGYGNMVMIDHGYDSNGNHIVTLYGHGSKLLKNVGDAVKKGDIVMEVGSTGNSTGPHVHFEVRENGVAVDPKKYLDSNSN